MAASRFPLTLGLTMHALVPKRKPKPDRLAGNEKPKHCCLGLGKSIDDQFVVSFSLFSAQAVFLDVVSQLLSFRVANQREQLSQLISRFSKFLAMASTGRLLGWILSTIEATDRFAFYCPKVQ